MYFLKMWHEARNDAKLRTLTDAQFRVWFNLLLFASEQPTRGEITYDSDEFLAAEVAQGNVELLLVTVKRLVTLHCVTERYIGVTGRYMGGQNGPENDPDVTPMKRLVFPNFEKRQEMSVTRNAKSSADRVRKYRERKKMGNHVTGVTPCNAPVTPMKRVTRNAVTHDVTACNGVTTTELELELESELEIIPPCVPPPAAGHTHTHREEDFSGHLGEAIKVLGSDPSTAKIGKQLAREHGKPALGDVEGWRWLKAAHRILEPDIPDGKRRSFRYLAAIAKDFDESERNEKPKRTRETKAERQLREMREGFANRKWEDDADGQA